METSCLVCMYLFVYACYYVYGSMKLMWTCGQLTTHNEQRRDQTATPGTPCPTLFDKCVGSLTSPANQNSEDAGDGAYGLSSLSEKT